MGAVARPADMPSLAMDFKIEIPFVRSAAGQVPFCRNTWAMAFQAWP